MTELALLGVPTSEVMVSVIVPCHDTRYGLEATLNALKNQDFQGTFEVIVGNDGDNPEVRELCERMGVTVVPVVPGGSSYRSRNRAIAASTGRYLGFTDANKVPRNDWISTGYSRMESGQKYVGGRIAMVPSSKGMNSAYWYQVYRAFPNETYLKKDSFAVTGNLFAWRELFEMVGLFEDSAVSGGDYDWGHRVADFGVKQYYCSDLVVYNSSRSLSELISKQMRASEGRLRQSIAAGRSLGDLISWKRILRTLLPPQPLEVNQLSPQERSSAHRLRVWIISLVLGAMLSFTLLRWRMGGRITSGSYY